jgi:hypothetical protein
MEEKEWKEKMEREQMEGESLAWIFLIENENNDEREIFFSGLFACHRSSFDAHLVRRRKRRKDGQGEDGQVNKHNDGQKRKTWVKHKDGHEDSHGWKTEKWTRWTVMQTKEHKWC